jgi:Mn2+/Fe2+ NRAMP family transporter
LPPPAATVALGIVGATALPMSTAFAAAETQPSQGDDRTIDGA